MQDYDKLLENIFNRDKSKTKLGLERMNEVMGKFHDPHKKIKTIHIAGTNGKGSVSSMITAILIQAGFKTGLFTSPFLVDFRESIQINNKMISKENVLALYKKIEPFSKDLTYFELKTAIAFLYFFENNVDYAVIETGLGGRLDATNIIVPSISVITNTALEHKEYLGNTIEEIAREKAGIIKENVPIITMVDNGGLTIIKKIAAEKNSPLIIPEKKDYSTNLRGNFQKKNASLAVEAAKKLGIDDEQIKKGLMNVQLRGRFDYIEENLIFDCAHNLHATEVLSKEMLNIKKGKIITIISIMNDKEKLGMIRNLESFTDKFIITSVNLERASNPEDISSLTKIPYEIEKNPVEALKKAKQEAQKNDKILVTGSCYLIGELMSCTILK